VYCLPYVYTGFMNRLLPLKSVKLDDVDQGLQRRRHPPLFPCAYPHGDGPFPKGTVGTPDLLRKFLPTVKHYSLSKARTQCVSRQVVSQKCYLD
jgi:hypothetical protein